jgi:uncharacterized membrane protein YeiB
MTPAQTQFGPPVPSTDNAGVILSRNQTIVHPAVGEPAVAPLRAAPPSSPRPSPELEPVLAPRESSSPRIIGFDFARAVAIFGMLVEHCCQVFGPRQPVGLGAVFMGMSTGRASAVFVVLAGAGVSLLGRSSRGANVHVTLFRRGSLLFMMGMLNRIIWPGDVLRLFGVTMMVAGVLHRVLGRRGLLLASGACVLAFPALYFAGLGWPVLDYNTHWNWDTSQYADAWSFDGIVRNLFYNGFRPVFPWAGLLLFGMWVGRLDVRLPKVRRNLIVWGLVVFALAETLSRVALAVLMRRWGGNGYWADIIRDMFAEGSLPPMPPFVLSVTGMATMVIGLCLTVGARWPRWRPLPALSATGQMALSWYIIHIAIGAGIVHYYGWHYIGGSIHVGIILAVLSFGVIVVASAYWRRHFRYGPFEYLLRAVS